MKNTASSLRVQNDEKSYRREKPNFGFLKLSHLLDTTNPKYYMFLDRILSVLSICVGFMGQNSNWDEKSLLESIE